MSYLNQWGGEEPSQWGQTTQVYDPETGGMVTGYATQTSTYTSGPHATPAHHPHGGYSKGDYYGDGYMSYCGSGCGGMRYCMGIGGLIAFLLLASGAVALGFALVNRSRIHTLEADVANLMTTVDSQGDMLALSNTPVIVSTTPAVITPDSSIQTLGCGGALCATTLPTDLAPFLALPDLCFYSTEAFAHTITLTGGATFEGGVNTIATLPATIGSHVCIKVITASTVAIKSFSPGTVFA